MSKRIEAKNLDIFYGDFKAVEDVSMTIEPRAVTAFIGPSGCGKSTFLRSLNRMHEVIPGAYVKGELLLDGEDLYAPAVDPVNVRRQIGMVFQRPNPFPTMSIKENVLAGLKLNNKKLSGAEGDEVAERAQLLVTVDCGVSAMEQVRHAQQKGESKRQNHLCQNQRRQPHQRHVRTHALRYAEYEQQAVAYAQDQQTASHRHSGKYLGWHRLFPQEILIGRQAADSAANGIGERQPYRKPRQEVQQVTIVNIQPGHSHRQDQPEQNVEDRQSCKGLHKSPCKTQYRPRVTGLEFAYHPVTP